MPFVYFLFLAAIVLVFGFYPVNKAAAQLTTNQVLCNLVLSGGNGPTGKNPDTTNYFITNFLPLDFPNSAVIQNAKNYSNWKSAGQTQESSYATNLEAIFFTTIFPEEPADANNRTSSMTEIYLDITIPGSLCPVPAEPTDSVGFNIFNKKAYAQTTGSGAPAENLAVNSSNIKFFNPGGDTTYVKQTYFDTADFRVRFTKLKRIIKLNAIDSENTKITVIPEIIQDNFQVNYVRYGKVVDLLLPGDVRPSRLDKFCVDEYNIIYGGLAGRNCYRQSYFYDSAEEKTYVIQWLMPVNGAGNGGQRTCFMGHCTGDTLTPNTPDANSSWAWTWTADSLSQYYWDTYHWLLLIAGSEYDIDGYYQPTVRQFVPIMTEENYSPYGWFKSVILGGSNSAVVSAVEKNENILIVNAPVCHTNSDSGATHSYVDTYCWRQGLSLDGRVGQGQWHHYSSGNGYLGDFFGGFIEGIATVFSLGIVNAHIGEANGTLIPNLTSLLVTDQNELLNIFAQDVINKYKGKFTSPQTYNLGFLGAVSDSIANPTKYFGAESGSDGNVWTWYGKFRELPTVTLKGPARVELPDKINLDWRTPTNSDTCTASGDWSGAKATSSIPGPLTESLTKMKGNYVFNISCTNVAGTAASSVRTEVKRVPRCDFSANPTKITLPEFSTLYWDCNYTDSTLWPYIGKSSADSCVFNNISGNRNTTDSQIVRPKETTIYTLTCSTNEGVSTSYTTKVTVDAPTGGAVIEVRP